MFRSLLATVLWAGLLLGGAPALAQEPSWVYLSLMTGPLVRVEACFEELGVPLPRMLRREKIEEDFPVIGPGGLRGEGALGLLMGPGETGSTQPVGIFLFPVNPEAAPLRGFTALGARAIPGSSDTVRLKGTFLRRPEGFLLTGPSQTYIAGVDARALEERLSAPGLLAEVEVDLDRMRKADPATFYSLLLNKERAPARSDPRHLEALGRSLGMRVYERLLNRVRLTLVDAGGHLPLPLRTRERLRGQLISWSTTAEGKAAIVDFDFPKPLA